MLHYGEQDYIEFISGIVWIPYCMLFMGLFYEQFTLRRYPQYVIVLFLLLGNIFRCVWFLGSSNQTAVIGYLTINRLAILFQFSALSLLILMWSRILKVSSTLSVDHNANRVVISPMSLENETFSAGGMKSDDLGNKDLYFPNPNVSNSRDVRRAQNISTAFGRLYLWGTVVINVIVWIFMLASILLSVQAIIIFFVGLSTGLRISKELSPVFLNVRSNSAKEKDMSMTRYFKGCFSSCGIIFYTPDTFLLHSQAKAVQKLLRVSSIIGIFFILRSICFAYRFFAQGAAYNASAYEFISEYGYPWFFYQFPELIPNLAIAYGIAPPNGILRRTMAWIQGGCCFCSTNPELSEKPSYSTDGRAKTTSTHSHSQWGVRAYDEDDDNYSISDGGYYSRDSNTSSEMRGSTRPLKEDDFDIRGLGVGSPGSASVHSNHSSFQSKSPVTPVTMDHFDSSPRNSIELTSERQSVTSSLF